MDPAGPDIISKLSYALQLLLGFLLSVSDNAGVQAAKASHEHVPAASFDLRVKLAPRTALCRRQPESARDTQRSRSRET
jgi:hypothetical protein